jgi:hypothetical protein
LQAAVAAVETKVLAMVAVEAAVELSIKQLQSQQAQLIP